MKKLLNIIFVIFGVLFVLQLFVLVYVFTFDPFNIKPLFSTVSIDQSGEVDDVHTESTSTPSINTQPVDRNPVLQANQEEALQAVGIDPAAVPTEITHEQATCFAEAIGEDRVAEIIAGAAPTPTEIFRGRNCL